MPLETEELNRIAKNWAWLHRLPRRSRARDEFFWAADRLGDIVREEPGEAWKIIEIIRHLDKSDEVIAVLAAGPLEDLLVYHGPEFIDRIETLARQDPKFRHLLGGVWQNAMHEDIWTRVLAASGPRW